MPLKISCVKLHLLSFPCKRCLLFFKAKGSQEANADPGPLIPFPLSSQLGIPCTSYPLLMSAYLLSPSDPVQEHYTVKGEQIPIK